MKQDTVSEKESQGAPPKLTTLDEHVENHLGVYKLSVPYNVIRALSQPILDLQSCARIILQGVRESIDERQDSSPDWAAHLGLVVAARIRSMPARDQRGWRGTLMTHIVNIVEEEHGDEFAFNTSGKIPYTGEDVAKHLEAGLWDLDIAGWEPPTAEEIAAAEKAAADAREAILLGNSQAARDRSYLFEAVDNHAARRTTSPTLFSAATFQMYRGQFLINPELAMQFEAYLKEKAGMRALDQFRAQAKAAGRAEELRAAFNRANLAAKNSLPRAVDSDGLPAVSLREFATSKEAQDTIDFGSDDEKLAYNTAILGLFNREIAYLMTPGGGGAIYRGMVEGQVQMSPVHVATDYYANVEIVQLTAKSGWKRVPAFKEWMRSPDRRTFSGMGFYTDSDKAPADHINLYTGTTVEPKKGSWRLLRRHLKTVICAGDMDLYVWLLDYISHLFQQPTEKPGTALVFTSREEGSGKSLVINFIARMLGGMALVTEDRDMAIGKFTGVMENKLFVALEEAVFAGSHEATARVKQLITAPQQKVERKNIDAYMVPSYARFAFTSNEAWSVNAGSHSRRFAVFNVSPEKVGDDEYFKELVAELESEEAQAAFLYDMLNRKITSNIRRAPVTDALRQQRELSLDAIGAVLVAAARDGTFVFDDQIVGSVSLDTHAPTSVPTKALVDLVQSKSSHHAKSRTESLLGRAMAAMGIKKRDTGKKNSSRYVYEIQSLEEFRTAVSKHYGVHAWPDPDEMADDVEDADNDNGDASLDVDLPNTPAVKALRAAQGKRKAG